MRLLIFFACLLAGTAALLVAAGGWRGRGPSEAPPTLPRAAAPAEGTLVPLESSSGSAGGLRLRTVGAPRYAMPEPFVYRDAGSGARVEIPHFLPWSFSARGARAVLADKGGGGSILFEDVTVFTYRTPETLAEAVRLRDDPRAIEDFVRLEIYAPRARADGIAQALQENGNDRSAPRDSAIVLDGGVEARDTRMEVLARGEALTFDPRTHLTQGQGRFVVEHAAWTLEGEGFTLAPDVREGRPSFDAAFRLEIARQVLLAVRENVLDAAGETVWRAEDFRPSRVFAGRAGVVHDGAAPGAALHIALEQGVRALQQGGRRLLCDRLSLALEPRTAGKDVTTRSWRLAHLVGEGRPLRIEVPDLETSRGSGGAGGLSAAQITARRLRHEPAANGPSTTVLEGDPVVLFEGELSLTGVSAPGRWIRASASDRAVLGPAPGVAIDPATGAPIVGRRVELRGRARLERRDGTGGPEADGSDVLEGDEISLVLRPARPEDGANVRDVPQSFAALGHVVLSGTRIEGAMERVVVEALDTLEPRLIVEGEDTRLAFVGFGRGQRLLGADPAAGTEEAGGAASDETRRTWTLDRLDAHGPVAGETRLGGPTVGVGAWIEGEHVSYERLSDRALLVGGAGAPALVQFEADATHRHALSAPRIAFERARSRVRAEDGSRAEIFVQRDGGSDLRGGLAGQTPQRGPAQRLELRTDGRIEVLLRVARPGGEPAPETPQVVRVLTPFTAEMRAPPPEAVDRLRAQSLEAVIALRTQVEVGTPSGGLARAGRPAPTAGTARAPARTTTQSPGAPVPLERWLLTSRSLTLDVAEGSLSALEADGKVVLDGTALHVEGAALRFNQALGMVWLDGGEGTILARMGVPTEGQSQFVARALRIAVDEQGPHWLLASGPTQAMLLRPDPKVPGRMERYEVDCPGDVRITDTELLAEASTTWVRRSLRPGPGLPFGEASDIWADRIQVQGKGLLVPGGGEASEAVRSVTASGPRTAFRSGEGTRRVDMWCERIDVDVPSGRAVLTGRPGRDVLVHFESGYDVELVRAAFDFRTGEVEDLEAGRAVLRRGR